MKRRDFILLAGAASAGTAAGACAAETRKCPFAGKFALNPATVRGYKLGLKEQVRLAIEAAHTHPRLTAPVPRLLLLALSLILLKLPLSEGPLLYFLEGIIGFVKDMNKNLETLHDPVYFRGEAEGIVVHGLGAEGLVPLGHLPADVPRA